MPNVQPQPAKTFASRRRLLRLGAYAPPAILGAMAISQQDAWASGGDKNSNHSSDSNSSGGGNASCAPCFCAPCGRSGEKNSKACDDKRKQCTTSGNSNSGEKHS